MKNTILFLAFLFSLISYSQANFTASKYEMKTEQDVFEISNTSAAELYQLSKVWISEMYKNPDRVIVADVENKLLKVNGYSEIPTKGIMGNTILKMKYSIQLDFKDDKIRVNISGLEGASPTNYTMFFKRDGSRRTTKEVQRYFTDIESYFNNLIDSLIQNLSSDDDW